MELPNYTIASQIKQLLFEAIHSIPGFAHTYPSSADEIHLEHPHSSLHGDYSSNIAMVLYKHLATDIASHVPSSSKKGTVWVINNDLHPNDPLELALEIVKRLNQKVQSEKTSFIEEIEAVAPGFINVHLSGEFLLQQVHEVIANADQYGRKARASAQKIMVEFTDPNPFKEFHIGHVYSNCVGESLARLLESQGAVVARANYQGDVGMHVAKSVWGAFKKMEKEKITLHALEKENLSERIKFLGQAYADGATAYEEDKGAAEEIKDINYLVYRAAQEYLKAKEDLVPYIDYTHFIKDSRFTLQAVAAFYEKGRDWSLAYFETLYRRLGTKFDYYFFESVVGEQGAKIVTEYLGKGVFRRSEGAIIFPGEEYGLHTRVFINSLGLPTYEAKELGLAPEKYRKFPFDQSIMITGNEINDYFKVLLAALSKINPELAKKAKHISHGMVRLPEGKMSSRTGKILTGEWLLDEAKKRALSIIEKSSDVAPHEQESLAESIAVGAVKYALLRQSIGRDIEFSFDESISLEGNAGPYLQYTYARARSVLKKAADGGFSVAQHYPAMGQKELTILRSIYQFPEVVCEATRQYAPNLVCNFLFDMAQQYNAFYNEQPILKAEKNTRQLRLLLTAAVAQVIKNGLYFLGISAPERM